MNINILKFKETAEAAKATAPADWAFKIVNAVEEILRNPFIHDTGHGLLILSDSGNIYLANGTCQCKAHQFKQVCWHRVCARLVELHKERGH